MRLARQILFISPLLATALPAQRERWYQSPLNGHLYSMSPSMSWQDAEAHAVSRGGHLAAIRSQAEESWLVERFGIQELWIGVTDIDVDGRFVRSDGQPSGFAPWAPGMPTGNPGADRVYMRETGWVSAPGGLQRPGIVEVPEMAAYIPFGVGCASSAGVPLLGAASGSRPRIGSTFTAQLSNLPTGPDAGSAFVLFGLSDTIAGSIPLPYDLSPLGLAGCIGYVSPDAVVPLSLTGSSAVQLPIDIPNLPRLFGLTFYNQALVEESGINPFGAVMSNAAEAVVGGVSVFTTGFGPGWTFPQGIAVGATHAFVADSGSSGIIAADLATGDRSVVSSVLTYGSGPSLNQPRALDLLGQRAFIISLTDTAVFEMDVMTGQRTILSDGGTGTGPILSSPVGIAVDGDRALVTDSSLAAVVGVDLATGDRAILSDAVTGAGLLTLQMPVGIAIDGDRALVVDNILAAIIAVDLATGDRVDVSSGGTGSGAMFRLPDSIAVDGDRALVTDRGLEAVIAVDLSTGDRTTLSDASNGIGPAFGSPCGIAIDGSRALVTDFDLDAVIAVDLQTGNRRVLSN